MTSPACRGELVVSESPSLPALPPFCRDAANGTVLDRWRAVVAARAGDVAVGGPAGPSTFGELDTRSDAIAKALLPSSRIGQPVLVLGGHDANAIAASIGIWKAGGAVVILDSANPDPRLHSLANVSAAAVCLASAEMCERARTTGVSTVYDIDAVIGSAANEALGAAANATESVATPTDVGPGTLAHIVFTSGSTGTPKGVCYPQRALLHDAWSRADAGWLQPSDAIVEPLPLGYAAGFHDCLAALLSGARIELLDPRAQGVTRFVGWLASTGATGLLATPSLLRRLASHLPDGQAFPGSLRLVRSTGEPFISRDARDLLDQLPERCSLINVLGSSETGLLASYQVTRDTPDSVEPLPVGWPLPDKDIRLVAENSDLPLAKLVAGADEPAGRMIVRSAFTATGYHGDPGQTSGVFFTLAGETPTVVTGDLMRRLDDGCLQLTGRRDHTLKIGGYRVEPAEVEAQLLACAQIREAVVVGQQHDSGTRLVAYVTSHQGQVVRPAFVRRSLRARLPAHMVPDIVMALDELPRNERGKLDRAALPVAARQFNYVRTENDWEEVVADLWRHVLGVAQVGRDDDFFELGGDSLAAEELFNKLAAEYGIDVDSKALLAAPTLVQFARQAIRQQDPAFHTLIPVKPSGTRPPLFCIAGGGGVGLGFLPLARRLPPDQPLWALQSPGLEARWSIPDWSIRRIAMRYVRELRSVQPRGPYHLAGHSFGGLVAFEMAHQLRAADETVALLAVIDSFAPDPTLIPSMPPGRLPERLKGWLTLAGTGIIPTPGHGHYNRFFRQSEALTRRYRGRPWPGETLVISARDAQVPGRGAEWGRYLTDRWQLTRLPGDHHSLMREPYVAALADTLESSLARVCGTCQPATTEPPEGLGQAS
jgi:acyl-CoA synthetase (AMP-forming)/AMP-acid ligase II/thioesterase domain-containing protein/acyl carrier protein